MSRAVYAGQYFANPKGARANQRATPRARCSDACSTGSRSTGARQYTSPRSVCSTACGRTRTSQRWTPRDERPMRSTEQRTLKKNRSNFSRDPEASSDDLKLHSVGELCFACRKCEVRLYKGEMTAAGNTFSFYCAQGQVQIPRISRPPSPLDDYLTAQTPATKHFRGNTRQFNNSLSMASTGVKVSDRIASGVQSFTVQITK